MDGNASNSFRASDGHYDRKIHELAAKYIEKWEKTLLRPSEIPQKLNSEIMANSLPTTIDLSDVSNFYKTKNVDALNTIPIIESSSSYEQFFRNFLWKNKPCIIDENITKTWPCRKNWFNDSGPSFDYLIEKYGDAKVPVADCKEKYYNSQKKSDYSLAHYMQYWQDYIEHNYSQDLPCLYLKDWHFTRDFPNEDIYRVPQYFASDWLNEFWSERTDQCDDYRFVYMGPKGSWTPFHADVFTSFSWSSNICGRKRWLIIPPGEERCFKDKHGQMAYDATAPELQNASDFPQHNQLQTMYDVIQEPGQAIFVPSGWHHQVWNLEDTISINHNWINGCNIDKVWESLQRSLADVQNEIADCKDMEDWDEQCQIILKATFGMDYEEFYKFLVHIANKRLRCIQKREELTVFGGWHFGVNHILLDLRILKDILLELISNTVTIKLCFYERVNDSAKSLLTEVDEVLCDF